MFALPGEDPTAADLFFLNRLSPSPVSLRSELPLRPKAGFSLTKDLHPCDDLFWQRSEQFLDDLMETPLFKRLDSIYVSPQGACMYRPEGEHPLDERIGRLTRGGHVRDALRIAVSDLKRRYDQGADYSAEFIVGACGATAVHDIAVSAFSHLSQDALEEEGIYVDHDLMLAFVMSQQWAKDLCDTWGINHKRFVASCLPPTLLTANMTDRQQAWGDLCSTMDELIASSPEKWEAYRTAFGYTERLSCVIDFTSREDDKLMREKAIVEAAQLAHDLFDPSYTRMDTATRERVEVVSASLLSHGELPEDRLYQQRRVSVSELPTELRGDLLGASGTLPSGQLFSCFVRAAHTGFYHFALVELKDHQYVLRAVADNGEKASVPDESLQHPLAKLVRVKLHKADARYKEMLRNTEANGDETWTLNSLLAFERLFRMMGDHQSQRVVAPVATVGRAVFASAVKNANEGKGIHPLDLVFGTHDVCVAQFSDRHRKAMLGGYNRDYEPLLSLRAHSSKTRLWVGPTAPQSSSLKRVWQEISQNVENFKKNHPGVEIVFASSAPVKKKYCFRLTKDGRQELNERRRRYPTDETEKSLWFFGRGRSDGDLFSLGFEFNQSNPDEGAFHYRVHQGLEIFVHKEDLTDAVLADLKGLRDAIATTLAKTPIREQEASGRGRRSRTIHWERLWSLEACQPLP